MDDAMINVQRVTIDEAMRVFEEPTHTEYTQAMRAGNAYPTMPTGNVAGTLTEEDLRRALTEMREEIRNYIPRPDYIIRNANAHFGMDAVTGIDVATVDDADAQVAQTATEILMQQGREMDARTPRYGDGRVNNARKEIEKLVHELFSVEGDKITRIDYRPDVFNDVYDVQITYLFTQRDVILPYSVVHEGQEIF